MIWNVLNCILGSFFFLIYCKNNIFYLKQCLLACIPVSLLALVAHVLAICGNCNLYDLRGDQPQLYHCYLFYLANIGITLRRYAVISPTREAIRIIITDCKLDAFFSESLCVVVFNLAVASLKAVIFYLTMDAHVTLLLRVILGYFCMLSHCCIVIQCSLICYAVVDRLIKIRSELCDQLISAKHVRRLREKMVDCNTTFSECIRIFSLDMFLSVSVSSLGACVVLNSIISITFIYYNSSMYTRAWYLTKLLFFTSRFLGLFSHVFWFSMIASKLSVKVGLFDKAEEFFC